jgi:hypothetical protein
MLAGTRVYLVMYNYNECDYSVVSIKENLENASEFIISQYPDLNSEFKIVSNIKRQSDVKQLKVSENEMLICHVVGNNLNINVSDYEGLSQYIISSITIS